jgi:hypothetical protein
MTIRRDQFKSSYGAFTSRERDLERSRALRDARDAAEQGGGESAAARQTPGAVGGIGLASPLMESGRARG